MSTFLWYAYVTEVRMMSDSRLFKILYYLLEKGQATATELATEFEVSVRTIYRDVDALSGAGIPVYAEAGRNGGIHLLDNFVLDKVILSEAEKEEILTALQSMLMTGAASEVTGTLTKLSALFNLNAANWLEADFSRWGGRQEDNKKFEDIKWAVIRRNAIEITYAGSYEKISKRKIYPLKLSYKSRAWYVKAYCTEKDDYRIFKLTRILDLKILNENFPCHIFPEKNTAPQQEYNQITLRFPREMAYRIYDEFDRTEVAIQENGDLLVSAKMPEDTWLVGYLLSFGTQVEVIEPLYLKNVIAEQAKQIYEKNKP